MSYFPTSKILIIKSAFCDSSSADLLSHVGTMTQIYATGAPLQAYINNMKWSIRIGWKSVAKQSVSR